VVVSQPPEKFPGPDQDNTLTRPKDSRTDAPLIAQACKIGNFGSIAIQDALLRTARMPEKTRLEEYHVVIQDFDDSLKGVNSATEEARVRCEKARRAC